MYEDIWRTVAPRQEAKAANPVEPLHARPFPIAFRRNLDVGTLRQLGGVDRGAFVHTEDAEGLQASGPFEHLTVHAGPLIRRLIAPGPETGDVQEHVCKP